MVKPWLVIVTTSLTLDVESRKTVILSAKHLTHAAIRMPRSGLLWYNHFMTDSGRELQPISIRLWEFMLQEAGRFRSSRFRREFRDLDSEILKQTVLTCLQLLWRQPLLPARPERWREALRLRRAWATLSAEHLPPPPDHILPRPILERWRKFPAAREKTFFDRRPWLGLLHPRWIYDHFIQLLDPETAVALLEANNHPPPQYLRVVSMDLEALLAVELTSLGLEYTQLGAGFFRLSASPLEVDLESLAAVRRGDLLVGGPSAAIIAEWLPLTGRILDICAAPGGKTMAIRGRSESSARVVAGDRTWSRVKKLRLGQQRLTEAVPVDLVVHDGQQLPYKDESFAAVLIDAPCSGSGILRRRPELRRRLKPVDLLRNVAIQATLLAGAAQLVQPGGRLIYATCSLEPAENELQIQKFLAGHSEFTPLSGIGGQAGWVFQARAGQTVRLDTHGIDGFYFSVLERRSSDSN